MKAAINKRLQELNTQQKIAEKAALRQSSLAGLFAPFVAARQENRRASQEMRAANPEAAGARVPILPVYPTANPISKENINALKGKLRRTRRLRRRSRKN